MGIITGTVNFKESRGAILANNRKEYAEIRTLSLGKTIYLTMEKDDKDNFKRFAGKVKAYVRNFVKKRNAEDDCNLQITAKSGIVIHKDERTGQETETKVVKIERLS